MYIADRKICETVEFPNNYFLLRKSLNHKIIDKKGVDPSPRDTKLFGFFSAVFRERNSPACN